MNGAVLGWVISDIIKGVLALWQLAYAAHKIRNEANVNLWRIKISCAIISLILLAWIPGLHNPYGYEWEVYLTFSALSTGLQLNQLLFLALILSNAAYAATLMTKFAPAHLPKLVFFGMSIVSISMFAGLVGVLITNSLRWNSSRYFAAVATVATGGVMVVMSAFKLRALLLKTQEMFSAPDTKRSGRSTRSAGPSIINTNDHRSEASVVVQMSVINSPRAHFSSNTGAIQASSGPCTPQRGIKYCSYKYNLRNEKNSKDDAPSGPHHDAQSDLIMQAQKRMIKKLKTLVCFGLVLMPIIIAFCMVKPISIVLQIREYHN
mmetsp:Transcript_32148/g.44833  ORF Transcript_32148/g.44833 Transcript_32148/m.44833 type:complete len:320 (-) Transcript_32148:282-1241(-)